MKYVLSLSLLLFCAILVLCGCGTSPQHVSKKRICAALPHDPLTLDPRKGGDLSSSIIHYMLFEGLTKSTPQSSSELSLAESVSISLDRTRYTFLLRKTHWSDGAPVTAHDFEYAWKSLLHPDFPSPNSNLLYVIKNARKAKQGLVTIDEIGVHAQSDTMLIVDLEHPTPYFLELTAFCGLFPVPSHRVKEDSKWAIAHAEGLISNGPFLLQSWKHNDGISLKKNPRFRNAKQIQLDEVAFAIVENPQTALHLYECGTIDILNNQQHAFHLDTLPNLKTRADFVSAPLAATTFCALNFDIPLCANKNIRWALSMALSRHTLLHTVSEAEGEIATGIIAPTLKENISIPYFTDNNAYLAKMLFLKGLDELRLDQEAVPTLTLIYPNFGNYERIALILQAAWKEALSYAIKLEKLEFKTFLSRLQSKQYEAAVFSWGAQYFDQMNVLERFAYKDNPKNYTGYDSESYKELLNHSFVADAQLRPAILEEAETLLIKDMAVIPLYHWCSSFLISPRCKGVYISPFGFCRFDSAYIEEAL